MGIAMGSCLQGPYSLSWEFRSRFVGMSMDSAQKNIACTVEEQHEPTCRMCKIFTTYEVLLGLCASFKSFWVNLSEFPHKGIAVEMKFQSGTLIFSSCSNVAAFLLRTQKGKATEWFSTLAFDTCRHVIDKPDDEDIRRPSILVVPEWFFNPEFISHTSVFASVGCYVKRSILKGSFWIETIFTILTTPGQLPLLGRLCGSG